MFYFVSNDTIHQALQCAMYLILIAHAILLYIKYTALPQFLQQTSNNMEEVSYIDTESSTEYESETPVDSESDSDNASNPLYEDSDYDSSDDHDDPLSPDEILFWTETITSSLDKKFDPNEKSISNSVFIVSPKSSKKPLVTCGTEHSVGYDLYWNKTTLVLAPGERKTVDIGIKIIQQGTHYWYTITPRSSATKMGLTIQNMPIIDPDYHGNIWLNLMNSGTDPIVIRRNTRFCQIVPFIRVPLDFLPTPLEAIENVNLDYTRTGGYGHTGGTISST